MIVCTMTRKQVLRIAAIAAAALAAAAIAITAAMGSITAAAEETPLPIYCVDRGDNKIALTFDCAWGNSNTDALLEILSAANAKATFFVTGEFCDKYPADVKKFSDAGHSVQNHSDAHPHIAGMNINNLIADTNACADKIKAITGKAPQLYRSPYGEYDTSAVMTIEGMGYKFIQWSADSIDWEDPDPAEIKKRILGKTESGSILLFHNDLENTEAALPSLLTELLQKGFEFVTVDDIIYKDSYYIDNTGKQIYQPDTHVIAYTGNAALDSAFEKIRTKLSLAEIYELSTTRKLDIFPTIKEFLSEEELYAIRSASYEELVEAYYSLVAAAENYGAGGAPIITEQPPKTTESNNYNEYYIPYQGDHNTAPNGEESKG